MFEMDLTGPISSFFKSSCPVKIIPRVLHIIGKPWRIPLKNIQAFEGLSRLSKSQCPNNSTIRKPLGKNVIHDISTRQNTDSWGQVFQKSTRVTFQTYGEMLCSRWAKDGCFQSTMAMNLGRKPNIVFHKNFIPTVKHGDGSIVICFVVSGLEGLAISEESMREY